MKNKGLSISNNVKELHNLTEFLEGLGEEWHISPKIIMQLNLVLEEILTNIIFYAWEDEKEHIIDMVFSSDEKLLTCRIIDDGKAFNPADAEAFTDASKPAEEREIGGLGIHFVKELTDGLEYARKDDINILTIRKQLL